MLKSVEMLWANRNGGKIDRLPRPHYFFFLYYVFSNLFNNDENIVWIVGKSYIIVYSFHLFQITGLLF